MSLFGLKGQKPLAQGNALGIIQGNALGKNVFKKTTPHRGKSIFNHENH